MRTIKMNPGMLNVIGRAGENLAVQARFRVTEEFSRLYGPGSFVLCLLRPDETAPYAVQTQVEDAVVGIVTIDDRIFNHGYIVAKTRMSDKKIFYHKGVVGRAG